MKMWNNNALDINTEREQSGKQQAAVSRRARSPDPFLKESSLAYNGERPSGTTEMFTGPHYACVSTAILSMVI